MASAGDDAGPRRSRLQSSRSLTSVQDVRNDRSSPLISLSQSLRDARLNADSILLSAQNNQHVRRIRDNLDGLETTLRREAEAKLRNIGQLKQLGNAEEWDLLKKLTAPGAQVTGTPGVPRSFSTSKLDRLSSALRRSETAERPASTLAGSQDSSVGALVPLLSPPGRAAILQEQAKQLASVEAARSVEAVTQTLLAAPLQALASCQATIGNCQQNLQSLGDLVTRNLVVSRLRVPARLKAGSNDDAGSDAGFRRLSWVALPGYLTPRGGEFDEGGQEEVGGDTLADRLDDMLAGRPLGPFQRQAQKRKRRKGHSSLAEPGRQVAIVTTAALPWMTGTAVNPLLRAAYLARDGTRKVTLMIPWLAKTDQQLVFPNNVTFDNPEQQEAYVRDWVRQRTGFDSAFKVTFYPGRYAAEKCSILPVGDPTEYIPDGEADVAVLEEPEHLTWYHHGQRWTDKFSHVVGVIHTNYLDYARREPGGPLKEALLRQLNDALCRIHCHKVVKLSDAVQPLPRSVTQFVHGVPDTFLQVGQKMAAPSEDGGPRFGKGAYFLGKVLWAKGYSELLQLVEAHKQQDGTPLQVDCFGGGEDLDKVRDESRRRALALQFHGARDHLDTSLHDYKLFINPSTSDVVATTTAEALAMGKWVVCAALPCNEFFSTFPNCLTYRNPSEFSEKVAYAMSRDPAPLRPDDVRRLTWEDATERFLRVSELSEAERPAGAAAALDSLLWGVHNTMTGMEPVRVGVGAGAHTLDAPPSLADYQPCPSNEGGIFDDKRRARATRAAAQQRQAGQ